MQASSLLMRFHPNARITAAIAVLLSCVAIVFLMEQMQWRRKSGQPATKPAEPGGDGSSDAGQNQLLSMLNTGQEPAAMVQTMARLRAALLAMPQGEAVAWINTRLEEGRDSQTGLGFVIGSDQSLKEWPSLRVFLLDVLMAIDPGAAAQAGREILAAPTSADEWALAMRNVARGSTAAEDTALLRQKSAELLQNAAWREKPSAGYLEAFDVIVHTRNVALSPQLLAFIAEKDHPAVRHAAFLTLDRLVLAEPAQMLPALLVAPPDGGLMISNMIARADVRDPVQRQAVESWLREEHRTASELEAFAGVFPNANMMVSPNLLTPVSTMQGADLAVKDRAALAVVDAWLNDPALARSHTLLRGTRERLQQFVP